MAASKRPNRTKNTLQNNVRVWVQLPHDTITVALGRPDMSNKTFIPEPWSVGHLPVYFGVGRTFSIALTDLTETELDHLVQAFNIAINAARPVCRLLDEQAFAALQSGTDLQEVPKRILRGDPPSLVRTINTILPCDPYEQDRDEPEDDDEADYAEIVQGQVSQVPIKEPS